MTIFVIERHDQLLDIWRSQNATNLCVTHLDYHCDMRGLLIDRPAQRAYDIGDVRAGVDQGNFLAHAILEGRIQRLRWVHDVPGGRRDDFKTVKYENDLSAQFALWRLMRQRQAGVHFAYEAMTFSEWSGLEAGEFLDIDWDVFACVEYPANTIEKRIESFLKRNFTYAPEHVSFCYSPEYSHPTRPQFEECIQRLAEMFQAKIQRFPTPSPEPERTSTYKKNIPRSLYKMLGTLHYRSNRWLRRWGIY